MDNEKLSTITYVDGGENPVVSICPGHVDSKTFQAAWLEEGWEGDEVSADELRHEHWMFNERYKLWEKSNQQEPKSRPMTVLDW